jgi:hypothetical protein
MIYSMAKSVQGNSGEEMSTATYKGIMVAAVHASAVGLGELLKK